jgi:Zn-dependent M16 (insulinase) family peptidase
MRTPLTRLITQRLREVLSGVSQYQLVKKISEEQNFDDLTAKFKAIAEFAAQKRFGC